MEPPPRQGRRTTAEAEEEDPRTITIHDIPDDLLRQILLHLDSPLWLVRAACASKPLRRAVVGGGRAFLRLAASLHPPVIVGHYHNRSMNRIAFVPSSTPPPPDRFALDFLPRDVTTTAFWEVSDCHGGLILLRGNFDNPPNIIVCDPLTRRYQGIPHPPVKRAAYAFALLDGDDGDISISNFRVLYVFFRGSHVWVFSAAGGGSGEWRILKLADDGGDFGHVAGRIDASLYLGSSTGNNVSVLNNAALKLSKVDLPIGIIGASKSPYGSRFTVVHGVGQNPTSPVTTRIVHVHGKDLEVFRRVSDGGSGGGGEWVLEHSIPKLSEAARGLLGCRPADKRLQWTEVSVISVGNGIVVLSARDRHGERKLLFSVDMDTKEMEVVPKEDYRRTRQTIAYTLPWRQFLRAYTS
ncbi:unnamed protein product [Urochloa humidicola]